jgi:exopolyphosphatase/guanosine-5'-triphosphate,3'-diphosphate pyrophosphatase
MAAPNYAALDLGTNTFRLLIVTPDDSTPLGYKPLCMERIITRAGGGFRADQGIGAEAQTRILDCLERFSNAMRQWNVVAYKAVATSVFRRAANRSAILAEVLRQTGIEVEVVDGIVEADWSARGAVSQVALEGPAIIFDIGGGSTEYILWDQGRVLHRASFEFGVVRLSEDVLRSDPATPGELAQLDAIVTPLVNKAAGDALAVNKGKPFTLLGTAGTVSTLGAIELGLSVYDRERINGHRLSRAFVAENLARFGRLGRAEKLLTPGIEPGREDLILPGCFIALQTMKALRCENLLVSEGGLLEGIIYDVLSAPRAAVRNKD